MYAVSSNIIQQAVNYNKRQPRTTQKSAILSAKGSALLTSALLYTCYTVLVLLFYLAKILDDAGVFYVLLVAFGELLLEVLIHLRFYIREEDIVKYNVVGINYYYVLKVLRFILQCL